MPTLTIDGMEVTVEPGATVGEVTSYLLRRGLQLECTLEMVDATIGGLAMAQGLTTHSHVCSLHEDCLVIIAWWSEPCCSPVLLRSRLPSLHGSPEPRLLQGVMRVRTSLPGSRKSASASSR